MSLISNRKRPRGLSESFPDLKLQVQQQSQDKQSQAAQVRPNTFLNLDYENLNLGNTSSSITGVSDCAASSSGSSTTTANSSASAASSDPLSTYSSSVQKANSINLDTIVVEDSEESLSSVTGSSSTGPLSSRDQQLDSDKVSIIEEEYFDNDDDVVIVDGDDFEPNIGDEDDDVVILEERNIGPSQLYDQAQQGQHHRSDSIVLLSNDEEESAYNMFNVHNIDANLNYNYGHIKKQRTSSLPQLPQVRCFYSRISPEIVLKVPKLGHIKPPVVQCNSKALIEYGDSSCDDNNGHYIIHEKHTFADGRFFIVRLLGQGTFGKVIECIDRYKDEKVAIKIIRNIPKYRDAAKIELRILATLKKFDYDNLNHCIHLKECFDYRGHICIVTDLLKISLFDFLEVNKFISFPGLHIQAILKQLIRSITFLHDLNIIHTDLKPENILLYNDDFIKTPLLSHTIRASYSNLKGNRIKKFPKFFKILKDPSIQIIDFGSAIFNDEYHSNIVSTRHYRAPEIILGTGWSFPCDIWSIGCILVELITGESLFKTHDNLEHLAMIEKICGYQIDKQMVKILKSMQNECGLKYFTSKSKVDGDDNGAFELKFYDNIDTLQDFIKSVSKLNRIDLFISERMGLDINCDYSLNENFERNKHLINFGNFTFWWFLIDLLRKIFIINPQKRLTAWDALLHPWFNLGIEDEGTINDTNNIKDKMKNFFARSIEDEIA